MNKLLPLGLNFLKKWPLRELKL